MRSKNKEKNIISKFVKLKKKLDKKNLHIDEIKITPKIKTPFCRIGRKENLLKILLPLFPKHSIYIEPFVGSGVVFFHKEEADKSVINDLDDNIYNLFKMLKKGKFNYSKFVLNYEEGEKVVNGKRVIKNKELVNKIYNKLLKSKDSNKEFQRRLMLNCLTFSGTQKGMLYQNGGLKNKLKKENLEYFVNKLKKVKVLNQDYKKVIKKYDNYDAFIFLDPPYENSNRLYEKNRIDYEEMRDLLQNIQGKFLLTINDSPKIRKIFNNFKIKKIDVKGEGGQDKFLGGKTRKELIITNY